MKQRITFFLGIFTLICVVLAGCSKDNGTTAPQIENINLNQSDITLNPGDSYTLTAETTPEDIEVTLIWSSPHPISYPSTTAGLSLPWPSERP